MKKVLITPRSYGKSDVSVFEKLKQAGFVYEVNDVGSILTKEQIIRRVADCDGVILGVDPFDADVIAAAPRLKAIAKYGVGLDNIDLAAAKARGIRVSKTMGANSEAVADYALALMLAVARQVCTIDAAARNGDWKKRTTTDVSRKTVGIIGFGAIGKLVAQRCKGFSMRVLAYDVFWDDAYAKDHGVEYAGFDTILRESDFISLHLPLLPETRGIIDGSAISQMKSDCILINTARGGLIDDNALMQALANNSILGAGLDAFATEPPDDPRWAQFPQVVLGSHCAASTVGAIRLMGQMATDHLIRDLSV